MVLKAANMIYVIGFGRLQLRQVTNFDLMVRLCNFVRLALIGLAVVDGLDHKLGEHGRGTRRSSTAGDVPLWCARTMHIISCTSGFFKSDVGTPPIFPEPMGVHISSMCRLKALLYSSTAPKPNIAQYTYFFFLHPFYCHNQICLSLFRLHCFHDYWCS